ncbi:hypothetical protein [Methylobacterium iners]|uniref:Uncharacterized protein n=1 Tax=Methylobacterium iners TaxID=418707 RepID=A0ABQ4RS79_9HYPH|nr:hypothetical protein [Methylobacterium iners]GJD93636.1 hypothetical protein OCOJLMKI_0832 [Methylobacterium iners]
MTLRLQPVRLASGNDDSEAQLVFAGNALVAVLTHLAEHHDGEAGRWFMEAWFGPGYVLNRPTFASLDKAQDWILERLAEV